MAMRRVILATAVSWTIGCGGGQTPPAGRGVEFANVSDQLALMRQSLPTSDGLGGAAWFDYDNDGDVDLFVGNGKGHPTALYRNDGHGSLTEVSAEAG